MAYALLALKLLSAYHVLIQLISVPSVPKVTIIHQMVSVFHVRFRGAHHALILANANSFKQPPT